jgi:energy-coupling factor transporter ATP-binding protein EcfA2
MSSFTITDPICLAELDRLGCVDDAAFNTSDTRSACLPNTRVEILDTLTQWTVNPTAEQQIYFLQGHAGSGKSTIAQSFAEWLFTDGKLGGSFFYSRESEDRNSMKKMLPTLAFQLAISTNPDAPKFKKSVIESLKAHPGIARMSLEDQFQHLLVTPATTSKMTTVIVIDALDECKDEETTSIFLGFLDKNVKYLPNIKFFVTSRPETHIREGFRLKELKLVTKTMILHEVPTLSVDNDIMVFLRTRLTSTDAFANRSDVNLPQPWPTDDQLTALMKKSGGLFIFASTVIKLILDKDGNPCKTLDSILSQYDGFADEGTSGLDELYSQVLGRAFSAKPDKLSSARRAILGLLVVASDPLSATAVADILQLEYTNGVKTCLRSLHSLLIVPDKPSEPIRFHHKSFPDFLMDPARCTDPRFFIAKDEHHFVVVQGCFRIMNEKLKRNIGGLKRYSKNSELSSSERDKCIDESLRYSCRYWHRHLLDNLRQAWDKHMQETSARLLEEWLKTKLLQWFEVLALLDDLGQAVEALNDVKEWLTSVRMLHWRIDAHY